MVEEIVVPSITDPVLPPLPTDESPKKSKPLKLLAGFSILLVVLAVGLMVLGGGKKNVVSDTSNPNEEKVADNVYQNKEYFYQLTLPPKWSAVTLSANDNATAMFTTSGAAMLSVAAIRQQGSLEAFLGLSDEEGGISIRKSSPIKVGTYDAVERYESWSDQGVEVIGAYVKIQDMIYSFNLLPTGEKNAVTNESLLREYRSVLASFDLTDTSTLGKDWVKHTNDQWEVSYPQNWKLTTKTHDQDGQIITTTIYRDDYEISIYQAPMGGGTCIFRGDDMIPGPVGDLRNKEFVEFVTNDVLTIRRYFWQNKGDKSVIAMCFRREADTLFTTPTPFGAITYNIPAKYDNDVLVEMDSIVKTLRGKESVGLTGAELSRGWYWGTEDQQKSGTPENWSWQEAGRSSCWHAPSVLCE